MASTGAAVDVASVVGRGAGAHAEETSSRAEACCCGGLLNSSVAGTRSSETKAWDESLSGFRPSVLGGDPQSVVITGVDVGGGAPRIERSAAAAAWVWFGLVT